MKVLLLRANPRKTGYTQRLASLFLQGLRETPARVADVDLTEQHILPCLGCYHCRLVTPGQCVHSDDMDPLLEQVLEADVIVCATPLYYFSMSSTLKTFFERTFPLTREGLSPSARGGLRNNLRHPDRWKGKRLITIIAGALSDIAVYRPANETFQLIADSLDLELGGQLTRPESYLLDYPLSKPKTLKRIESAFIQAGREAGATGRLSPETQSAASLPLAADLEHFRAYSNIYWAQAMQMGEQAMAPEKVQARVGENVRILIREMVRSLDPGAAARTQAVLQFDFPDERQHFRVTVDRGRVHLEETTTSQPDLRVRCDAGVWARVFTRQIDVRQALLNRQLVLEGDKSLFARLDRLFPPPPD
ncbi:MAG: NAD(P)H-dependent oxidoreductase [Verrucomicrobiota bacterium]